MPKCDAYYCDNAATPGTYEELCDSCTDDQIDCDDLVCDCCTDPGYEPQEYMTYDVMMDVMGRSMYEYEEPNPYHGTYSEM